MPELTNSAQEAGKTTGATPGSPAGSMGTGVSGAASRTSREHSSTGSSGYGVSGESSTMGRGVGEMRRGAGESYGRAGQGLNETWGQVMDYSREHPGKSTLIAFGVGVGVGLLMGGGFTARSRARRIVPPVMNALSEIASELFR